PCLPSQYSDLARMLVREFSAQNSRGMVSGVDSHTMDLMPFSQNSSGLLWSGFAQAQLGQSKPFLWLMVSETLAVRAVPISSSDGSIACSIAGRPTAHVARLPILISASVKSSRGAEWCIPLPHCRTHWDC